MPELPTRNQQPRPVSAQVPIPNDFPDIPQSIVDRFPEAEDWQRRLDSFWERANQAIQEAQQQTSNQVNSQVIYSVDSFRIYSNDQPMPLFTLDGTGLRLGDVLVINTPGRKVYIGEGVYAGASTPFYIDTLGFFSLGDSLTWDPETDTLSITGVINVTSGTIGGFDIGADYIRDTGNTFGLASTVTGGDDVRLWAGAAFAARATAPFRVTEGGVITATSGTVGGWTLASTTLTGGNATLASTGVLTLGTSNDVAILSAADATYRLWIGHATAASAPFSVTKGGALVATGATITGTITATSGAIGGFSIGSDYIRDAADSMGMASTVTGGDDVRFWAGDTFANRASAPFRVLESGIIVATAAAITGTISGRSTATIASTIDVSGIVVTDLINARLNTSAKTMLSNFTFGTADYSGALQSGTIAWNTTTGAITGGSGVLVYRGGIIGAVAGVASFTIDATTGAATFAGALSAPTGNIGGWTIGASTLTGGSATLASSGVLTLGTSNDVAIVSAADATYRLWVGHATAASAPFSVTKAGALFATGATISGTITATSGTIGGFDVGADYIRDSIDSFGLASTVTGSNDVRFWAGSTFANRATAPFRIYEDGTITVGPGASYQYNNVRMVSGITSLSNFFFGPSGNFTMSGSGNTAIGNGVLVANTTGSGNFASGTSALAANTTGADNFAFGSSALLSNTTGNSNLAIGGNALAANTTGYGNFAIGAGALASSQTAAINIGVGENALVLLTSGTVNVAVGFGSLSSLTSGTGNIAIGTGSLGNLASTATGANTVVGTNSGLGITTGSHNTIIGAYVSGLAAGLTNNIILAIGTGSIKAQFDGTNWTLSGGITGSSYTGGAISGTTGTFSSLTSGRVPIVSTSGLLVDDSDMTFSGTRLTVTDLTVTGFPAFSAGTSTRIPFFTTAGLLTDSASLTFNSATGALTATTFVGTLSGAAAAGTLTGTTLASNVVTSSLTTVGIIGSGTWQGTAIGAQYGGTGLTSYAVGDLIYASGVTTLAKLADVATGSVLVSGGIGVAPAWSASPTLTSVTATTFTGTLVGAAAAGSLTGTTLASNVVTSSLTTVGILNSGSITNGFGSIDVGADSISGGAASFTTIAASGKITVTSANVRLSNNYYLSGNLVAGTEVALIGRNTSNQVSIDADGYGTVFGGSISGGAFSGTTGTFSGKIASTVASGSFGLQIEAGARFSLDGGGNTYIEESSADVINFVTGGASRGQFTSTGLAVTGTVTAAASTDVIIGTEASTGDGRGVIAATASANGNAGYSWRTNGVNRWTMDTVGTSDSESVRIRKLGTGAATIATFATTGLSITGLLGATGNIYTGNNAFAVNSGSTDGWYTQAAGQMVQSVNGDVAQYIRRRTSDGAIISFYRGTTEVGTISVTTTSTAYNTSSDGRLKTDLGIFSLNDVAAPIYALSGSMRKYAWNVWLSSEDEATRARASYGWFAQEAQSVAPWMVTHDSKTDRYYLNPMSLFPNVVACLGVHKSEIDLLKEKVARLEEEVKKWKAK